MSMKKPSMSTVLFSKAQQRLFGVLFTQPDNDFNTNEIIRLTSIGTGVIHRELLKLTAAGILIRKNVGNQKRYQANCNCPLFQELRNISLKTFGLADIIADAVKPISKHIQIAFIYGSIAKQEDTANSDIDLLLISNDISYVDVYPLLIKAEKKLGRKINPSCYSRTEWHRKYTAKNHFITEITKQPKIFLIGDKHELNNIGVK